MLTLMMAAQTEYGTEYEADAEYVFPILDAQYWLPQIFWLGVSFLILYLLLSRVLLPPIGQTLEDRSSRIADDVDSAARMQREAEEASEAYERELKDARAEARSVAEATKASVEAEIAAEIAEADAQSDKAARIAEERIQGIRAEALANIDRVADEAASSIVAKLAGKPLKAARKSAKA